MNSAIAVLTYRRRVALETFLRSLAEKCPLGIPVAVFEDCANFDDTRGFLTLGAAFKGIDAELDAEVWERPADRGAPALTAYLGRRNVGVASSSNKAIRWFERQPAAQHLLLCNDDIEALGDFPAEYAKAHSELKVGLLCLCDVAVMGEDYRGPEVKVMGTAVKLIPAGRQTGCMMSITRELMQRIGYFDVSFGRMGQEHVDYNSRATMAGFTNLRGKPQICLDLAKPSLRMQVCRPSISGAERSALDRYANDVIRHVSARYFTERWHRPYRLLHPARTGGYNGVGIPVKLLEEVGYALVVDYDYNDAKSTL